MTAMKMTRGIGPIRTAGLSTKGGVTRVTLSTNSRPPLCPIGEKSVDKRLATGLSCSPSFAISPNHRILP